MLRVLVYTVVCIAWYKTVHYIVGIDCDPVSRNDVYICAINRSIGLCTASGNDTNATAIQAYYDPLVLFNITVGQI